MHATVTHFITADIVESIPSAVETALRLLRFQDVQFQEYHQLGEQDAFHEVSSVVGLSGSVRGSVCISLPREVATRIGDLRLGLTDHSNAKWNDLEIDGVNELANSLAAHCKEFLCISDLKLGLPSTIVGHGVDITFPFKSDPIRFCFETDLGPLVVVVGFIDSRS